MKNEGVLLGNTFLKGFTTIDYLELMRQKSLVNIKIGNTLLSVSGRYLDENEQLFWLME